MRNDDIRYLSYMYTCTHILYVYRTIYAKLSAFAVSCDIYCSRKLKVED